MNKYDYKICPDCGRDDCNGNCYDIPKELWTEVYGIEKATQLKNSKKKHYENVSKKIPVGRTFQTKDEFFKGQQHYRKEGYGEKEYYRPIVVIDTNQKNEIGAVKLTSSETATFLENYRNGELGYKPYLLTRNANDKPIKKDIYFIENKPSKDLAQADVEKIKIDLLTNKFTKKQNQKRLKQLKSRK